ncbi:MAG: tetratricopeptide repeat protein [Pirellulales bacterium]|nr:tetratricopeptide repeat protein [Pirellulales bacterium]
MSRFALQVYWLVLALACAASVRAAEPGEADDQYSVAAGHYARSNWKLATEEFDKFVRSYAGDPRVNTARFYLAEAQVQLGQYDAARVNFQAVLQFEPEGKHARQAQFRAGECSYLAGQSDAAKTELTAFREKFPDDPQLAFVLPYLAELALNAGDATAAQREFSRALEKFPQGAMADDCRMGLARIDEAAGRHAEAAKRFGELAANRAGALAEQAQFQCAASQYAAQDHAAAAESFARLLEHWPDSELRDRARLGRGWALYHLKQYDEALKLFDSLAQHAELAPQARYWLGLTHRATGDWSQAAEALQAMADEFPQHELTAAALYHAGDAWIQAEKYVAAAAALHCVDEHWPESPWRDEADAALVQLAVLEQDHARVEQLATAFLDRFAGSPLAAQVRRAWGRSQLDEGKYAAAIETIQPLVTDAQADARVKASDSYLLALAHKGLGQHDQALAALAPALAATDAEQRANAQFLEASLLVADGKFAEALVPLKSYLEQRPNGDQAASCRAQLAVCLAKTDQLPAAREAFAQFDALQPPEEILLPAVRQLAEAAEAAHGDDWAAELYGRLAADGHPAEFAAVGLSGLAWNQLRAGRAADAAANFDKLLSRYPDHPLAAAAGLARGQVLETLDQPDGALAMYQRVIERYPQAKERAEALLRAARLHDRLKQDADALACYDRFVSEFADHDQHDAALYESAWVLRDLARLPEADARFAQLRSEHPQSRFWNDATYRLAERAQQEGRYDEAETLIDELLARQPQPPVLEHALYLQGQVAAAAQKWDAAERAMQRLLETAPDTTLRPMAEYWIAESAYRRDDFNAAGERFARLAQATEGRQEPWVAMVALRQGQVLAHQNRWSEAEAVAKSVLERWPHFDQRYEADYLLGRALASRGEFEPAREAYRRVLRSATGGKTETAAMAQWMIGEAYFHQNNYDAALREYLRLEILYAYPTWQAGALLQAAKCHELLGEWKEATELYARLLQGYPQTKFTEEAAQRLRRAQSQASAAR